MYREQMIFCSIDQMERLPLYVTTVGYWDHQNEMDRPAGFPDYQLHQVLKGKGELAIRGEHYVVGEGEAFFLFPNIPHAYTPLTGQWQVSWVSFNGREVSHMLQYAGIGESGPAKLKDARMLPDLERILMAEADSEPEASLERSKLLYALLIDLKRALLTPVNLDAEINRMKPVLQYIDHNLSHSISLDELADVAKVTPQYLCRLFQQTLRMRPTVYINQQRINRSKQLMVQDATRKMYEIARLVGFDNVSYFCAVFRKQTGMSPESFKKLHGLSH